MGGGGGGGEGGGENAKILPDIWFAVKAISI